MENLIQARELLSNNFTQYGRYLERYGLEDNVSNYEEFLIKGGINWRKNCHATDLIVFLADANEEGCGLFITKENQEMCFTDKFSFSVDNDVIHINEEDRNLIIELIEGDKVFYGEDFIKINDLEIELF